MATPEAGNDADSLDDRIEKRINLLRDSIELKVTKEIDHLLQTRFETTVKILGWTFGLVAVVFTFTGWKTIIDVRDIAHTSALEEVRKKLAIDDPHSDFRRDIDKLAARTVIDSYLFSLARNKRKTFGFDLRITESDLRRLIDLISDRSTSDKDFADGCEILYQSNQMQTEQGLDRLFRNLGSGVDEKYSWIREQPNKRAALFRIYRGENLKRTARDILNDEKTEKPLLIESIKYLSDTKDAERSKLLARLAKHKDEDVAFAALLGLASVEPESPELKAVLDKPMATKRIEDWGKALRLASVIARQPFLGFLQEDPKVLERISIASKVLENAVDQDLIFRLASFRSSISSLHISFRTGLSTYYSIPSEVIKGSGSSVIEDLLVRLRSDEKRVTRLLQALCLEKDGQCWGVVRISFAEGGSLLMKSGLVIDRKSAPGGVSLRATNSSSNTDIRATWTDGAAITKSGTFAKISDPKGIHIEMVATKRIDDDESDDDNLDS